MLLFEKYRQWLETNPYGLPWDYAQENFYYPSDIEIAAELLTLGECFCELWNLINKTYCEGCVDKKMRKVTKQMRTAEKDIKKGKPKSAVKALKKAENKNMKLADYDEKVRDPMIAKCKKMKKK